MKNCYLHHFGQVAVFCLLQKFCQDATTAKVVAPMRLVVFFVRRLEAA